MNRISIPVTEIIVLDRQRNLNEGHVAELAESIQNVGLIQPIVINQDKRLIAGGHRLAATIKLGRSTIDVVYKETMSEDEFQEFELTENIKRKDLTWQETTLAIMKIHFLKRRQTALSAVLWGQAETGKLLKVNQSHVSHAIVVARHLLDNDKEILACECFDAAWSVIMRREQELAEAELAMRHVNKLTASDDSFMQFTNTPEPFDAPSVETVGHELSDADIARTYDQQLSQIKKEKPGLDYFLSVNEYPHLVERVKHHFITAGKRPEAEFDSYWQQKIYEAGHQEFIVNLSSHYLKGDSIPYMLSNPETYDHIITDIPYGISIDRLDQHIGISDIEIIKAEHTVAGNEELFRQFFPAAFCTLKPNSFLITWCDAMQWQNMYNLACEAGFKVQRWPFVWAKDYPCLNQKAQFNFTKSTEFAMVCRKGTITLPEKQTNNYIIASRDQLVEDCQHPFAKPFAIWERLFKAVTMENQKILDPFCGKGSSFISGLKLGRNMYGVEKDEALYNGGLEVLKSYYLKLNAKSVFK